MERIFKSIFRLLLFIVGVATIISCEDLVEDGIRVEHGETDAQLQITALPDTFGVQGGTVSFSIKANSNQNIRAFNIVPRYQGAAGTHISYPAVDPFIDHSYGTIQKNTKSFEIIFNYVIPSEVNKIIIEFSLTDEMGKKTVDQTIEVVDDVVLYSGIELHTINNYQTDGFSTFNGEAYRNLKDYELVTVENRTVQQNLDFLFLADIENDNAKLAAPAYSGFISAMKIKNRTNFMLLDNITAEDFENAGPGTINKIVPVDEITEANNLVVENLKVGDYIGFVTDYNASNSYKTGLLWVKSLHPSSCEWYEGRTYVIEYEVKVEVSDE